MAKAEARGEGIQPDLTERERVALIGVINDVRNRFQLVLAEVDDKILYLARERNGKAEPPDEFKTKKSILAGQLLIASPEEVPFGGISYPLEIWTVSEFLPTSGEETISLIDDSDLEEKDKEGLRLVRYKGVDNEHSPIRATLLQNVATRVTGKYLIEPETTVVQIGRLWEENEDYLWLGRLLFQPMPPRGGAVGS